jgi:Xaa-Pro aminopeptidase
MFSAGTYADRRASLAATVGSGVLVFLGNGESPMNYTDNTYPFRQDSTWLYYFGIDHAGLAALVDIDERRAVVFGNDLTLDDIVWTGPQPTVAELAARAGVTESAPAAALADALERARSGGRTIHYLPPYRDEHRLTLSRLLGMPVGRVDAGFSLAFVRAVVNMRNHKTDEEVAEIERAVDTSVDMHVAAMQMVRPGLRESDVAARVTEIALASGGGLSFPVIATIHGETLHNHYHGHTLASGNLFLLDCGAETAMHYAGDLSSAFPVSTTFDGRQKDVYQVVLEAHLAAVAAVKPGRPFREIHLLACRTIAEGMKGLGLMAGDPDEAVAAGAHAMFFQCGLGHMMGLDVHDMENLGEVWVGYDGLPKSTQFGLKSLRLARPLEPGFVLTVEPGVYFIPELIRRWKAEGRFTEFIRYDKLEAFADFGGARIEENLVVTPDGHRILGKPRPRTVEEIEAVRRG